MGNVLIVKNNDKNNNIYDNAYQSYKNKERRYYYTRDNTQNESYVKKIKNRIEGESLILFITYNYADPKEIEEVFIGSNVEITDRNNIKYSMKLHLTKENDANAIDSIIDKIDLDLAKDFEPNCYVIMSDMESLFCELKERIIAKNQLKLAVNKSEIECSGEEYTLGEYAQKDIQSVRIYPSDKTDAFRTEFQRDRERVVNCKAFRRLVDKAQIFGAEKGDYYRTRMTHSLEVNQIAKAIAYALKLNLDLTEAIALGHDLGHTPFGHQGERTLDDILRGKLKVELGVSDEFLKKGYFGGFKHNYQSARILTQLEEKYIDFPGLNVSVQVVEGVLKHTKMNSEIPLQDFLKQEYIDKINVVEDVDEQICSSLEGQTVAIADEIAQRGHDVDDALTSGVMSIEEFIDRLKISKCSQLETKIAREISQIEKTERVLVDKKELTIARIVSAIINFFITSTIAHSGKKLSEMNCHKEINLNNTEKLIEFSPEAASVNSYLERIVQKKVICNCEVARADYNANVIVKTLFEKYYENPRLLHQGTIHKIFVETLMHENEIVANSAVNLADGRVKIVNEEIRQMTKEPIDEMEILSYLETGEVEGREKQVIIFEKRKILLRAITDYIAGMTDGYALEEYEKLK